MASYSTEAITALLDKLASDDDFRAKLVASPKEALGSIGIDADAADIPATRTLPSKEVIEANKAVLKDKLGGQVNMALFLLAGNV